LNPGLNFSQQKSSWRWITQGITVNGPLTVLTLSTVILDSLSFWRSDSTNRQACCNYGAKWLWRCHCTALLAMQQILFPKESLPIFSKVFLLGKHVLTIIWLQKPFNYIQASHTWLAFQHKASLAVPVSNKLIVSISVFALSAFFFLFSFFE